VGEPETTRAQGFRRARVDSHGDVRSEPSSAGAAARARAPTPVASTLRRLVSRASASSHMRVILSEARVILSSHARCALVEKEHGPNSIVISCHVLRSAARVILSAARVILSAARVILSAARVILSAAKDPPVGKNNFCASAATHSEYGCDRRCRPWVAPAVPRHDAGTR